METAGRQVAEDHQNSWEGRREDIKLVEEMGGIKRGSVGTIVQM